MLVEMKIQIQGARNGEVWPPPGGTIDVPDHEAADLIAAGYAKEATDANSTGDTTGDDSTPGTTEPGDDATRDDDSTPGNGPETTVPRAQQPRKPRK